MFEAKVECPKCHQVWTLPQGSDGTYCNCHLWCQYGTKPSDCNLTQQNYNGPINWPVGLDQGQDDEGSDVLHRTYYCSIHEVYSYKQPIYLEVDWEKWRNLKRLPSKWKELAGR